MYGTYILAYFKVFAVPCVVAILHITDSRPSAKKFNVKIFYKTCIYVVDSHRFYSTCINS